MDTRLTLSARRAARFYAVMAVAFCAACNFSLSPQTRAARKELSDKALFRAAGENSCSFYSSDGSFLSAIQLDREDSRRSRETMISVAPDSSRFVFIRRTYYNHFGSCRSLVIKDQNGSSWEILKRCLDSSTNDTSRQQIVWAAPDGSSLLVLEESVLWLFEGNDDGVLGTELESNVKAFDYTTDTLYLLEKADPSTLRWRTLGVAANQSSGSLALAQNFDGIEAIPGVNKLLLYRKNLDRSGAIHGVVLLDLKSNSTKKLLLPFEVQVYRFLPLKGSRKVAVLALQGGERFDGTVLPRFYLWDIHSGEFTWILTAWKEFEFHELPGNFG